MSHNSVRMVSFFLATRETVAEPAWQPAADVYRTHYGWLVKFDLAGVNPADISLEALGHTLSVSGIRRDVCYDEGRQYRMEIPHSHFARTLKLPVHLDTADITSELRQGLLLVRIRES